MVPLMEDIPLESTLAVGAIIFFIGLFGILVRRNLLILLMCIELMLNAVNLTFVAFSKHLQDLGGELSVLFVIPVAAAESAVGLGLLIAFFRNAKSTHTDQLQTLRD